MDLSPYLANTAVQDGVDESSVRLFRELIGCTVLSGPQAGNTTLSLKGVHDQAAGELGETFKAALASAIHFQVRHCILMIYASRC
jgi:hypothetical protein